MKVSKEKLKQMIKEELQKVMKESEADLEEIKGAMGARMASLGDADDAIARAGAADDEEDDSYEADLYGPELSKDQEIDDMLERMGVDPLSKEGMDLRVAIKAAAEKNAKRYSDRRDDRMSGGDGNMHGDRLAQREPTGRLTKKGKMFKTDADLRKHQIATNLAKGLKETDLEEAKAHGGAEEKGEHKGETVAQKAKHEKGESAAKEKGEHEKEKMEEAQIENLRESFRRFTKLPKDTLKD